MDAQAEQIRFVEVRGQRIATVFHRADADRVVLLCHGFRGSKIGPSRLFVRLARRLRVAGISTLRFDQYGSGDSEGEFVDSSFDDWVATTRVLAERRLGRGAQIALLGQSMGGAAALVVAAELGDRLSSVVAWVPDPSIDEAPAVGEHDEEGGQRVGWRFWHEANRADVARRFREIQAPTLVFFATDDDYVSPANQQALIEARRPHQRIVILDKHTHSGWSYDQAEQVVDQSTEHLVAHFRRSRASLDSSSSTADR